MVRENISNFGGVFAKTKQASFWDHNFSGATLRPGLKAFDIWMAFEEGLGFFFSELENHEEKQTMNPEMDKMSGVSWLDDSIYRFSLKETD